MKKVGVVMMCLLLFVAVGLAQRGRSGGGISHGGGTSFRGGSFSRGSSFGSGSFSRNSIGVLSSSRTTYRGGYSGYHGNYSGYRSNYRGYRGAYGYRGGHAWGYYSGGPYYYSGYYNYWRWPYSGVGYYPYYYDYPYYSYYGYPYYSGYSYPYYDVSPAQDNAVADESLPPLDDSYNDTNGASDNNDTIYARKPSQGTVTDTRGRIWVTPHWKLTDEGWLWIEGYWKKTQ